VREALMDKRTYTIYPDLSRWIAGGIKVCAVSNFIYIGSFIFWRGEGDLGFFIMKRDQRGKGYFYKICRIFKVYF
jgi:hypothetical protein